MRIQGSVSCPKVLITRSGQAKRGASPTVREGSFVSDAKKLEPSLTVGLVPGDLTPPRGRGNNMTTQERNN